MRRNMRKNGISALLILCLMTTASTGAAYDVFAQKTKDTQSTQSEESTTANTEENIKEIIEEDVFDGGSGTEEDPYQIADLDCFLTFASNVNDGSRGGYAGTYFLLTQDLDLTDVEWDPIGNMDDMEGHSTLFLGSFDGGDHVISNLTYESDDYNCGAGLFGVNCGEVKNLIVENATVSVTDGTSLAIGGVVGYNMGSVDHVTIKGDSVITGNNCTGGIVGGNNNSVTNCTVEDATVIVIGDNEFEKDRIVQADVAECGGLVIGGGFGGTIDNCIASGTVKAEGKEPVGLGGIGGCLEMMDSITNCTVDVTIETAKGGHAIGGLCGYAGTHSDPDVCLETEGFSTKNYPSVIDNCEVTVSIKAEGATHVGGLIGTGLYYYGEETAFKITNCSVTGSIDGAVTPGTVAGRAEGSSIESCKADVSIDGTKGTDSIGTTSCMYESADQYEEE